MRPVRVWPGTAACVRLAADVAAGRWHVERKMNGFRAICIRQGLGLAQVMSRHGRPLDGVPPEVHAFVKSLPEGTVLDGELLTPRRAGRRPKGTDNTLYLFDVLEWRGQDVRPITIEERRRIVEGAAQGHAAVIVSVWKPTPDLAAAYAEAVKAGDEGLVLKRTGSRYGRDADWLKVKAPGA